jgi:flagellar export protein FliJ
MGRVVGGAAVRRFHFRLERVLHLKRQQEALAEMQLRQAQAALAAAQAEEAALQQRLAQLAQTDEEARQGGEALGLWQTRHEQALALGEQIQAAQQKVARAAAVVHEAHLRRVEAATEVEALTLLRQQQWEEHRDEESRRLQNQLDESVLRRWQGPGQGEAGEDRSAHRGGLP